MKSTFNGYKLVHYIQIDDNLRCKYILDELGITAECFMARFLASDREWFYILRFATKEDLTLYKLWDTNYNELYIPIVGVYGSKLVFDDRQVFI